MIQKQLLRRSMWASVSRVIGVGLGVGAGSVIHQLAGEMLNGWTAAILMAIGSFVLMLVAEYRKEETPVSSSSGEPVKQASLEERKY